MAVIVCVDSSQLFFLPSFSPSLPSLPSPPSPSSSLPYQESFKEAQKLYTILFSLLLLSQEGGKKKGEKGEKGEEEEEEGEGELSGVISLCLKNLFLESRVLKYFFEQQKDQELLFEAFNNGKHIISNHIYIDYGI